MGKGIREKVALLVFAALVVFAGAVLTSYISTGRTWTQAATLVDDTLGNMNGYTGIVFNGVIPAEKEAEAAPDADPEVSSGSVAEMIRLHALPLAGRSASGAFEGIFLSDVRSIYEEKGARVITLDVRDLAGHAEPVVYRVGDKRIGVFSAPSYLRSSEVDAIVAALEDEGANEIVCIAPREAMLGSSSGIDILLLTEDPEGTNVRIVGNEATVVTSPTEGEVGVILLSPNDVPLVREISSL